MSILALALSTIFMAGMPDPGFVKPVNQGETKIRTMNPINLVGLSAEKKFINVGKKPVSYDELRYYAIHNCRHNANPNREIIDMLIRVEKTFNPPPELRGMLLSAACMESGYNPFAKGDRKFSKKKKPMAIGILQQWPIYEKMFPWMNRQNPEHASRTWMTHIVKMIPKIKRQCKHRTEEKIWIAAWVTGIRYKKPGGRCFERPLHYRLLRKWHKAIVNDRLKDNYCRDEEACGC